MKKLQNTFTTPEQSKRLLELGVPADSADLYFPSFENGDKSQPHLLYDLSYSQRVPIGYEKLYLPCWSAGQLIEIFATIYTRHSVYITEDMIKTSIVDSLVSDIEKGVNMGWFDFSKLEE